MLPREAHLQRAWYLPGLSWAVCVAARTDGAMALQCVCIRAGTDGHMVLQVVCIGSGTDGVMVL
eukprot:167469-Rhodomonas_salina.1